MDDRPARDARAVPEQCSGRDPTTEDPHDPEALLRHRGRRPDPEDARRSTAGAASKGGIPETAADGEAEGSVPAGDGTSAEAPSAFGAFQASAYAPIQSAGFDGALGSAATARGITPLLEGKITLDEFCPAPDYSDLGAEVLSLDSLAAQVKSLEPRTPPDSPPRDGYGRLAKETPASEKKKPTPAKKTPAKPLADEAGTGHPRAAAAGGAFADVSSEFRLVENSRTEVELSGASASRESDSESDSLKRPLEAKYLTAPEVPGWIAAPYPETLDLVPVDFGAVVLEFRSGVERLLDATEQLGPEAEEAESRVARLLQALRWRITRAPEGPCSASRRREQRARATSLHYSRPTSQTLPSPAPGRSWTLCCSGAADAFAPSAWAGERPGDLWGRAAIPPLPWEPRGLRACAVR